MQARGLKPILENQLTLSEIVAPHAGAWIETHQHKKQRKTSFVAPHAGAWIETLERVGTREINFVAPHAGAWIETLQG